MSAVVAEGLKKRFGDTEALSGLDLVVPPATVMGLLGPNGAGKTTSVRIFSTLMKPDAGRATIDGFDVVTQAQEVRARIGLTGQYAAVDERLTGKENLELIGRYYHLGGRESKRRAVDLLERFDLVEASSRVVKGYSGGMRRRLDIAMSLIARPSVLFLDEPTTGLDPRSRVAMWELIEELVREGTTTLLTTQYLDEADRLATSIAVIDHGRVIAEGTSDQLKAKVGGDQLEIQVAPQDLTAAREAIALFAKGEITVDADTNALRCAIDTKVGIVPEVVRHFDSHQLVINNISVQRPTLDDVFMNLTGRKAEEVINSETVIDGQKKKKTKRGAGDS
jgi:ABC-2 type transport system ATP-binding protein